MPKLRTLSRVFKKRAKQEEDVAILYDGFGNYAYFLTSQPHINKEADNDTCSTCSTNATADNIPGAGLSIDKYFYQPVGRWIERFAMRFTIASLHPAHILRYFEAQPYLSLNVYPPSSLDDLVARMCEEQNGSTALAGLKSLVKQTA